MLQMHGYQGTTGLGSNAQGMMELIILVNNPRHQGLCYKHATTRTKKSNPLIIKNILLGVQHSSNQVSPHELGNSSAIVCLISFQANIVAKVDNALMNDILTTITSASSTHSNENYVGVDFLAPPNNIDIWLASTSSASSSSDSGIAPTLDTRPESIIQGLRNMTIRPTSPRNLP